MESAFKEVVNKCYGDKEFVENYNQLTDSSLRVQKKPIDFMIDEATGVTTEQLMGFIKFVDEFVWQPMIRNQQKI